MVNADCEGRKDQGFVLSDFDLGEDIVLSEVEVVLLDVIHAADKKSGHTDQEKYLLDNTVCF